LKKMNLKESKKIRDVFFAYRKEKYFKTQSSNIT
jgi:hypothetical protein